MELYFLIGAAVLAALLYFGYQYVNKLKSTDMDISRPEHRREDLYFTYYGAEKQQVAETRDHVNMHWEILTDNIEEMVARINDAKVFTVIDSGHYLFERIEHQSYKIHPDAENKFRGFLTRLRELDGLKYIKGMTAIDEPNLNTTEADYRLVVDIMKRVVAEFPELNGIKYFCIYTGFKDFFATEIVDVVGVDYYYRKSAIFRPYLGKHWELTKLLKPGQQTIVIPGGATAVDVYEQDPVPFVNYAQRNPEVFAIVAFLWSDINGLTGIRSNKMKEAYIREGKYVTGK